MGRVLSKKRGVIIIGILIALRILISCFNSAKFAISPIKAMILRDNTNYFIIHLESDMGVSGVYLDNDGDICPVILTGKSPEKELHHDISDGEYVSNSFLIKGYIDNDLRGEFKVPVIYVEDWDIIFPVRRRVQHWVDGEGNDRIFSPLICLDKHDVSTGLYCDIYPDFRAIDKIEQRSIILKSDLTAFELKADIADGKLQWKRMEVENISNVTLKEDVISQHFSEEILEWNTFLVLGTIDENGEIEIDEWYMLGQICKPQGKMVEKGIFHVLCEKDTSRYYFSQEEVEAGWYKP